MKLLVDQVYMTHCPFLKERKNRLLEEYDCEWTWIEDEPTLSQIKKIYPNENDRNRWNQRKTGALFRKLNYPDISNIHKHMTAWRDIVSRGFDTALVLEDDVILSDNFETEFNINLLSTPDDWDVIFIGSGCDLRIPEHLIEFGKVAYKKEHPASKCADSYILRGHSAEKLLSTMRSCIMPIDFEMNWHMQKNHLNVYWWEPPIVVQGSENGLYKTSMVR